MILIEDKTKEKYDSDTVEVWTYNMKLRFKIEDCYVQSMNERSYDIISHSGEFIATFPKSETAYMKKTTETTSQITQTTEN